LNLTSDNSEILIIRHLRRTAGLLHFTRKKASSMKQANRIKGICCTSGRKKTCPSATLPATKLTWTDLGPNWHSWLF